ncbi:MAG: HD domain-containing protein [Chlorobi bacterium]|nr:HD domain-containing protein [Chlorobiota bacterium]
MFSYINITGLLCGTFCHDAHLLWLDLSNNKIQISVLSLVFFLLLFIVLTVFTTKKIVKHYKEKYREEYDRKLKIKEKLLTSHPKIDYEKVTIHGGKRYHKYKKVTVLFADIQGFTRIVEHMNPELLIDELDKFFFHFDEVVEKYGIEKIKTIGDAYMCAGGLPRKNSTNPVEVVLAAIEMQQYMKGEMHSIIEDENELGFWELRIGIHTGPVISGVIGQKKLSFDIWGDTVNIASRMESSGVAGEINITGVTYQLTKEFFDFEYRGKMPVKYKGETDMYFVKGIRKELSNEGKGLEPNELFFIRLQHIRYIDLEEKILDKLTKEIPEDMFYHNSVHTKDVITRVEVLGRAEGVADEDMLLLKTAALLHDTGFLIKYDDHEENSILFAREILPKYKYSERQVEEVVKLIEITKVNQNPVTLPEKILKDADLDYLGRPDFVPVSEKLYKEITRYGKRMSIEEWNKMQYEFISKHTYYTESAKKLRHVNKEKQLQKLKELLTV